MLHTGNEAQIKMLLPNLSVWGYVRIMHNNVWRRVGVDRLDRILWRTYNNRTDFGLTLPIFITMTSNTRIIIRVDDLALDVVFPVIAAGKWDSAIGITFCLSSMYSVKNKKSLKIFL